MHTYEAISVDLEEIEDYMSFRFYQYVRNETMNPGQIISMQKPRHCTIEDFKGIEEAFEKYHQEMPNSLLCA